MARSGHSRLLFWTAFSAGFIAGLVVGAYVALFLIGSAFGP